MSNSLGRWLHFLLLLLLFFFSCGKEWKREKEKKKKRERAPVHGRPSFDPRYLRSDNNTNIKEKGCVCVRVSVCVSVRTCLLAGLWPPPQHYHRRIGLFRPTDNIFFFSFSLVLRLALTTATSNQPKRPPPSWLHFLFYLFIYFFFLLNLIRFAPGLVSVCYTFPLCTEEDD